MALRPGRLRRQLRDPNAPTRYVIDPYTREEAALLLETARVHYPEWYALLLCALRTGLRLGELRALEWGDVDWRQPLCSVVSRGGTGHLYSRMPSRALTPDRMASHHVAPPMATTAVKHATMIACRPGVSRNRNCPVVDIM